MPSPYRHFQLVLFQSTLSVRRATFDLGDFSGLEAISIHALRKESDGYVHHLHPR